MIPMFRVYRRANGAGTEIWGIEFSGETRRTIRIRTDGTVELGKLSLNNLHAMLAKLARSGFKSDEQTLFFDDVNQEFTSKYPDFATALKGSRYVLFAEPADITQAIVSLDAMAAGMCITPLLEKERDWVNKQLQNSSFLVATDVDPLWSLLIAELAMDSHWPISSSVSDIPSTKPSKSPLDWVTWLSNFFAAETVQKAQRDLGWTAVKLINTSTNEPSVGTLPVDFLLC